MELRRYWQIILKRRYTLIWIIAIIVGTTMIASLIPRPVYMFYSNVWIKTSDPKASLVGSLPTELTGLGIISTDTVMYHQQAMARNLSMIQGVINEMGLKNPKGEPLSAKGFLDPGTLALVTQKVGVRVNVLQTTQFLQFQGFSSSPEQAAEIANRVAAGFVRFYNNNIQNTGKQASRFILENIPQISAQLREAEQDLVQYKVANHVNNISYFREKLLSSLASLKDEADTNRRELADAEKRNAQLQEKMKKIPEFQKASQEYRTNPTLLYLREKLLDMESSLASSRVKVTAEHMTARQSKASLNKLREEYKQQVSRILYTENTARNSNYDSLVKSLVENEVNLVIRTSRQELLNKQIANRQADLDDLTRTEVAMDPLTRKVTALTTALNNLLAQEQIARLASELNLSNASILERAAVPIDKQYLNQYRWFPKRQLLAMFSLVLALLGGMATILVLEYLDDTLSDPSEPEDYLKFPVLGSLPELSPSETGDLRQAMANVAWAQALWALPDMLKLGGKASQPAVWSVTSTAAGEGKSLVVGSLGWVMALRGLRVLLVDLNFFHPSLHSLWHLPPGNGVSELLQGTAVMTQCVRQVGPKELYLLPNGMAAAAMGPHLDPKLLAHWLTNVKTGFDVLLLDLPAVGAGEGAPLAALGEQTLLVVAADHSPRTQIARAAEQIQRCHGRIAGLVLNRFKTYELGPLVSATLSAFTSWPPLQRLLTLMSERIKIILARKK
jgi:succinoglycan biosynthesis transport protein ExoP